VSEKEFLWHWNTQRSEKNQSILSEKILLLTAASSNTLPDWEQRKRSRKSSFKLKL